jgi:hypothetical protein
MGTYFTSMLFPPALAPGLGEFSDSRSDGLFQMHNCARNPLEGVLTKFRGIVKQTAIRGTGAQSSIVCLSPVDRVKQKLARRPELLAAHKRPPCDSTMERQIRSPMPVP